MKQRLAEAVWVLLACTVLLAQQAPTKNSTPDPAVPAPGQPESAKAASAAQSPAETPQSTPAQAPTPPDYSQEAYVIESFVESVTFENDGTGREQTDARIKVVGESGVQALGQLKVGYSALSDKLDIAYVRVHKPDGTVVEAQESAIQDLTMPDAPVYTDYHQKHISVPSLRPGDVLEYRFVRNIVDPLAPGQFWTSFNFADRGVVLDEQLVINVPKARQIKLKTQPGFEPRIADEGDRRIYRWTHSRLKDEQKKAGNPGKKGRPRDEDEIPSVELTTFDSWEALGAWYSSLERERRLPDAAVKAKADELVAGKTDDMQRVKALYDYVSRNFRYVSLSFGLGRYQPHAATEVLSNGYGDCKDKNTLLASLLQAEGLPATSVLIGFRHTLDPDIPSPSQFDHVITLVTVKGSYVWLDSTSGIAPFRMLAAPLRDKQALAVPQNGKARLVATPAGLPFEAYNRSSVEGSVSDVGKLSAHVTMSVRGDTELAMRYALRQMPSSKWKELFELMFRYSGMKNAEITNVKASDPSNADDPLDVEFDLAASNYFDWSAPESKVALQFNRVPLPEVVDDDGKSSKPIKLGDTGEIQTSVKLTIPAKYSVHPPIGIDVKRDYAEYHSSYKYEAGKLTAERAMNVVASELPYSRLPDYDAFRRAVAADEAQQASLRNTSPGGGGAAPNESAEDLNNAALQALKNERYDLAVSLLQRVLKLEPRHKTAWEGLGVAYLGLNQNQEAIDAFKKQIEFNAYDQFAYTYLGMAYQRQQKYDLAVQQFQKQIEINPLDPRAHADLGSLYSTQKDYAAAVPELQKAVDLDPQNAVLRVSLGQAYLATGQAEKGMASFEKAISLAPTPLIWNNVAYSLAEQNVQLERADNYIDAAITGIETQLRDVKLDSLRTQDLAAANLLFSMWDTKGWIAFKRGELDTAEQWIRPAWQASGRGDEAEHLADIYQRKGQREQAVHYYTESLAADNPGAEARARLVELKATKDLDHRIQQARRDGQQNRAIRLNHTDDGQADFFLLLSPSKVEQVRFVKGDAGLQSLSGLLEAANIDMKFPRQSQVRVPRRGRVSCGLAAPNSRIQPIPRDSPSAAPGRAASVPGACTLELIPSDLVRGLD